MSARLVSVLVGLSILASCFPSLDGLTGDPLSSDAGDARRADAGSTAPEEAGSRTDASVVTDGSGETGDAGPLLPNGLFELAGSKCGPGWDGTSVSLSLVSPGRTGTTACRACKIGNPGELETIAGSVPAKAGTYKLGAWIGVSTVGNKAQDVNVKLQALQLGSVIASQVVTVAIADAGATEWRPAQLTLVAPTNTDALRVSFEDSGCYVVDDVVLVRAP